ncbi:cytochrome P450 714C2-like [Lolium rigidum]|uniref:cytochrome P450 714C2-like n=1 Tax=Lolium rigidum TaxID=89674 RepID=UPI001F5E08C5|nr:cytochrome P450 714C2-like [Lolium rigidum]
MHISMSFLSLILSGTLMEIILSSSPWLLLIPLIFLSVLLFSYLYTTLWLRPGRLRQKLRSQGVKGPKPSFLFGNIPEMRKIQKLATSDREQESGRSTDRFSSNFVATLFPYLLHWSRVYGSIYFYATGSIQVLNVTDSDMVKALANYKALDLGKPSFLQKERGALLGMGILTANGELWVHQRKVIAAEFFMDKVKGMVDLMMDAAVLMLNSWEDKVVSKGGRAEIVVDEFLRNFSADIISRTSFGSSFTEGREIFYNIRQLQKAMAKQTMLIGVPGSRYLPTKGNREIWNLESCIRTLILNIVKKHEHDSETSPNKFLLHSIIEGSKAASFSSCTPEDFIVDNCKNIYFAGHETTSSTAAWCLMLLASHPEWQSRARVEVLEVCHGEPLDFDMLRKLKTLTMVIQETLRLYPPASFITREALNDINLGGIDIPKGTNIRVPIALAHRDPSAWGADCDRFDPGRFASGIARACKPHHMYMPFGVGPRTCAGQNLAMVELKVVLSLVLSRFEFELSANYVHRPAFRLTVEPGDGVPLIFRKL